MVQFPVGAFYKKGQLLLQYDLGSDPIFLLATWPVVNFNAGEHNFQMAFLELAIEPPANPTDLQRNWQPVTLFKFMRWQALVGTVLERFAPEDSETASLVTIQNSDLVLHRHGNGTLRIDRLEDKPATLRVTRYITEEAFTAEANETLRAELAGTTGIKGPVLFAAGTNEGDNTFIFFNCDTGQSVFIALAPTPSSPIMGLDFSLRMVDAIALRSHIISALRQPLTLANRLLWLAWHSVAAMLPRGISGTSEPGPIGNHEPMDPEVWERRLDQLVGRNQYRGRMDLLIDGEAFFEALIQTIIGAQESIDVRLFIFDRDDYALRIADLLRERSREIRVRVLMDRFGTLAAGHMPGGSPYRSRIEPQESIVSYLRRDSKVEVRMVDNPWLTSDHTKVIVIDHNQAFVGGMNIGHEYRYTWHDLMVAVSGPIVGRLSKDFDKRWAHAGIGGDLAFALAALKPESYRGPSENPDFMNIRPLYTRTGDPQILRAQLAAIRQAKSRIYIQQPYVSDDQLVSEMIIARKRGVDVRFILPTRGDSRFMDSANLITAKALLRNGIRVYAYPRMTHLKAGLYDDWAILGSANFDKLSLRINQETDLATSDPRFVEQLERDLFERDFTLATELTEAEPVRWRDYIANAIAEHL